MRFLFFFLTLLVLLVGMSVYIHRRASTLFHLQSRSRKLLGALMASGIGAIVLSRLAMNGMGQSLPKALGLYGMTVTLSVIVSSILLAVVDLPRIAVAIVQRIIEKPAPARVKEVTLPAAEPAASAFAEQGAEAQAQALPPQEKERETNTINIQLPPMARRNFLAQGAAASAFAAGTGTAFYGAIFGRHDYQIEEIVIPVPGLPKQLDGFCIAQLSDIHIGLFVGEPELRSAEALVQKTKADMIVLTGDLIDSSARFTPELGRLVRRLKPLAREGVVAIPGNHDYFAGIDPVMEALVRGEARVLRNNGLVIGDAGGAFALLGVDDVWAKRMMPGAGPDLPRALKDIENKDLARVLLCHNPVFFPEAAGQVALQLSGHTHGGQVNLVVRPADWVLPHGYVAGQYEKNGSRLYINRGFGTAGPPARVQAPPEVSRIVLVSA